MIWFIESFLRLYELKKYAKGGKFADGGMVNSNGEHYTYFEYVAKDDYLQDTIYFVKIGVNEDVAKNDAEGIEHHVSTETLSVFQKFNRK